MKHRKNEPPAKTQIMVYNAPEGHLSEKWDWYSKNVLFFLAKKFVKTNIISTSVVFCLSGKIVDTRVEMSGRNLIFSIGF